MSGDDTPPRRGAGRARGARALEWSWVGLASLLFGLAFGHHALERIDKPGTLLDWDQNLLYHWVPYETVMRFHQVPLWNPYACGGTPMLGDPPSRVATPFFLLHLLLGPIVALKLEVVLHIAVAAAGCYALARTVGLGRAAAAASAVVFPACSYHYLHIAVGHTSWLPYAYLPWIAACGWRAIETRRLAPAALGGLLLAIVVGEGGVYAAPHAALLVGVLAVAAAISRRDAWPLAALGATATFAFGFAAPKLLLTWQLMHHHRRLVDSHEATSPSLLLTALFSRAPSPDLPLGDYGFHEYGAYVGPCAVVLVLCGMLLAWRRAWPWTLVALVFLLLALGDVGRWAPWTLLHRLPPFSSQHVPSRFVIVAVLAAGVLAGHGAEALIDRHRRWGAIAAALLTVAGTVDAFLVATPSLEWISGDAPAPAPSAAEFRQVWASSEQMLPNAMASMGSLNCYDPVALEAAAHGFNRSSYRGEQHVTGRGSVRLTRWTPNALEYDVELLEAGSLVVNQNFDAPWTLLGGDGEVYSRDGLLAVHLPAGSRHVVLRYRSAPFAAGLGLALAALVAAVIVWRRERRNAAGQGAGATGGAGAV